MTECTGQPLLFSSLGKPQVVANFGGGRLTSDAGALLLREVDRRIGLTAGLAEALADPLEQGLHRGRVRDVTRPPDDSVRART